MSSRNASFRDHVLTGVMLAPLRYAFGALLGAAGIVLLTWVVQWTFVVNVWPEGIEHLKAILAADRAHGEALAIRQGVSPEVIIGAANFLYGVLFEATGIHAMGERFAEGSALSVPDTIMRNTYLDNWKAVEVAMVGAQLLGVRCATIFLVTPLVLLFYSVGAMDGLSERGIRRASGGSESSSLYHRGKYAQVIVVGGVILVCAVWPEPVDTPAMGLGIGVLIGLAARVQWAFYKKYL